MEDQPDIVLMDVNLDGGREGIEAARWLREVCEIRVVFITVYTDHDTVARIHEQVPGAPVSSLSPLLTNGSLKLDGSETLSEQQISGGVVHDLPADLKKALTSNAKALETWEDITPLARNEWICWIESAKKAETRNRRIEWGCSSLEDGKRRPCCWPGCPHR